MQRTGPGSASINGLFATCTPVMDGCRRFCREAWIVAFTRVSLAENGMRPGGRREDPSMIATRKRLYKADYSDVQ
ncbi:hypothetical protein WG66_000332 [Moniliophthora roreri]|nr:hypothetical protein WG66_000332 [Moniliophthora roreri]